MSRVFSPESLSWKRAAGWRAVFVFVLALAVGGFGVFPAGAASAPAAPPKGPGGPGVVTKPAMGLGPYTAWVASLGSNKEQQNAEQDSLVFYSGRLAEWDLVSTLLRIPTLTGPRRASMYLAATRAARFNKDWPRAKEFLGKLRDAIASIPKTDRSFDLLSGFCLEAAALRQAEGINERFDEAGNKVEEVESPIERFARLQRLALVTVYAHDEKTFNDLGSAMVHFVQQWTQAEPGFGSTPAKGDVAMKHFIDELIAAGEYGLAAQLAQTSLSDQAMVAEVMFRAQSAGLASAPDDKIEQEIEKIAGHHERLAIVLGTVDNSGVAFFAARNNRTDLVTRLLARARDLGFTPSTYDPNDGVARNRDQLPALAFLREHWPKAVRAAAEEYVRAGTPEQAAALGALYTDKRVVVPPAQKSDLPDLLADQVAFALYLAQAGQTTEARRLLDALPADYVTVGAARSEYARLDLATARALLGDVGVAQSVAETLKNAALRAQAFSAVVVAAQLKGESSRANSAFSSAAKSFADPDTRVTTPEGLGAYMAALAVTGSSTTAWKMVGDVPPAQASAILDETIKRLVHDGHWAETAGWIGVAPDERKSEAWHAYFRLAAPDPEVTPFAAGEMVGGTPAPADNTSESSSSEKPASGASATPSPSTTPPASASGSPAAGGAVKP